MQNEDNWLSTPALAECRALVGAMDGEDLAVSIKRALAEAKREAREACAAIAAKVLAEDCNAGSMAAHIAEVILTEIRATIPTDDKEPDPS